MENKYPRKRWRQPRRADKCMALNKALDTTPDVFLAGSIRCKNEAWQDVAQLLRGMNGKKLDLAM